MIATLVLTRFATRPSLGEKGMFGVPLDKVFDPARLALRLETLAMVTAPSLRAQTAQDFKWLIITDPMLPAETRAKLEAVVADMPQALIVRIDEVLEGGENIGHRRWLEPFVAPEASHVLTANLDNDDGLGRHFIERLRAQAEADIGNPNVSAMRLYGQGQARQWDMFGVEGARFGAAKPWNRRDPWGRPYFMSPGYACCAPRRADIQVLGVPHHVAHAGEDRPEYLKRSRWLGGPRRRYTPQDSWFASHERLRARLEGLDTLTPDRTACRWVCMMAGGENELLMLNHSSNAEAGRKSEKPEARREVVGPESFGEVAVDWARIEHFFKSQTS
ncbi:putative rhamnosyl transferase [bacterium]|nr:putative rhamnosyl transferase [bacterium]